MNHVYLSDDEIKQLALPLLNQPGIGHGLTVDDLAIHGPELEGDADVWKVEVTHPSGAQIDAATSIKFGSQFTRAVFQRGDTRLFILRHQVGHASRQAA